MQQRACDRTVPIRRIFLVLSYLLFARLQTYPMLLKMRFLGKLCQPGRHNLNSLKSSVFTVCEALIGFPLCVGRGSCGDFCARNPGSDLCLCLRVPFYPSLLLENDPFGVEGTKKKKKNAPNRRSSTEADPGCRPFA